MYILQRLAMVMSAVGLVLTAACSQSDPGITTAVKLKLAANDTVKAYQIDVDTSNGVVTLTGTVDSPAAKEQAVIVARGTDGVTEVVDRIVVGGPVTSTPGEIRNDLEAAGRSTKDAAERGLDATKNAAERGIDATKDAAERGVDATKRAAERTGEFVADAAITTAVKAKLLGDTTTPGLKIEVETKDGVVTLNGSVKSTLEADRALSLARGTDGVKRVVSHLKING